MSRAITRSSLMALMTLMALLTLGSVRAQAAGSPQWLITPIAEPTDFLAGSTGDKYLISVTNTGETSSDGTPVTVTVTLPGYLTATEMTCIDAGTGIEITPELATLPCVDPSIVIPGDVLQVKLTVNAPASPPAGAPTTIRVSGGGAQNASTTTITPIMPTIGSTPAAFGTTGFSTVLSTSQAGAHPNLTTTFAFKQKGVEAPVDNPRDLGIDLPPGLIGNPNAAPKCTMGLVVADRCTSDMTVGMAVVNTPEAVHVAQVYNIRPNPGEPAAFAFTVIGYPVRIDTSVRSGGDYGVHIAVPDVDETIPLVSSSVTLWGVPANYNGPNGPDTRFGTTGAHTFGGPGDGTRLPFLRNPTSCEDGRSTPSLTADSWENPGQPQTEYASLPAFSGCGLLMFNPSISMLPDSFQAGAPVAYDFDLHLPQSENPDGLATPDLERATVALPIGTVLSPASANGLQGCKETPGVDPATVAGEFGLRSNSPASCPAGSNVGSVKIETPLLSKPLEGQVFVAEPECGPCTPADAQSGRMIRLLLQAQGSGVIVKLQGSVSVDPITGRLTTRFEDNPQLPFEDLRLHINGGPHASLVNPDTCVQPAVTLSDLAPWSSPLVADSTPSSSFNPGGCPNPVPFSPTFSAGTSNNSADGFSPFTMTLSRGDREQYLDAIALRTPPGLLGLLAQVPLCPEPQASTGLCPDQSLIGHTVVGSGPGSDPLYLSGKVFLTGPYKGAPFGLTVVVPAVAGPFNLGLVVVRAGITVDPHTAQITITSDPLPEELDGIPLRLRTVNVTVDRAGFVFNPTSCAALTVSATAASTQGVVTALANRFQGAACGELAFKPKLTATTTGRASARGTGASLDVKISAKGGPQSARPAAEANIRDVKFTLPRLLPARLSTLQQACTAAQFESNPAGCPSASNVGTAVAHTPVLNSALTGPAFLVSHGGAAFPDLEIVLQGQGVTLILDGSTNITGSVTTSDFASVPDAPISSFELKLPESTHSALASPHGNLCGQELLAATRIVGQNGMVKTQNTNIEVSGCRATIAITRVTSSARTLAVVIKTAAKGTVTVSGPGLRGVRKVVGAGTHKLDVALTPAGRVARSHHHEIQIRASLKAGTHTVSSRIRARL